MCRRQREVRGCAGRMSPLGEQLRSRALEAGRASADRTGCVDHLQEHADRLPGRLLAQVVLEVESSKRMPDLGRTVVDEAVDQLHQRRLFEPQPRPPRPIAPVCEREDGEVALGQRGAGADRVAHFVAVATGDGPDRLEQPVAGRALVSLDVDERLVRERPHDLGHVVRIDAVVAHGGHRGRQIEAADEHREAPEHGSVHRIEQLVAPVDQPLQGPLALVDRVVTTPERRQPVADAVEDLARREHVGAGRRELDGQRHAVESAADLEQHGVVLGSRRARSLSPSSVDEQVDALQGDGERGHEHRVLSRNPEPRRGWSRARQCRSRRPAPSWPARGRRGRRARSCRGQRAPGGSGDGRRSLRRGPRHPGSRRAPRRPHR